MQEHRCVNPLKPPELYHPARVGFSNFQFLENEFGAYLPNTEGAVRRCFSIARMLGTNTLVRESIAPAGMMLYEHQKLQEAGASVNGIYRYSFWRRFLFDEKDISSLVDSDCIGYVIIQDIRLPKSDVVKWHVFEAVFNPMMQTNWVVPSVGQYTFNVGGCLFSIRGNLYCQQDGVATVCAHVALRTLISRISCDHDISYETIDGSAAKAGTIDLGLGLKIEQIETVLADANFEFEDFCYDKELMKESYDERHLKMHVPIDRFLYAGVESGLGSLLGFKLESHAEKSVDSNGMRKDSRHIIPIFGHAFNGLSWISEAGRKYFMEKDDDVLYSTGVCWTDGFLGHDDNVGPEVFIPKNYVRSRYQSYVLNVLKHKYHSTGVFVEDVAREFMEKYIGQNLSESQWARRIRGLLRSAPGEVIYRAISISSRDYCRWLMQIVDWDGGYETKYDCCALKDVLPDMLWVVEVSCPHLYPANLRKIGDIIFDAEAITKNALKEGQPKPPFVMARFPMVYMERPSFSTNKEGKPVMTYTSRDSRIMSHVPCIQIGIKNIERGI